MDVGPSSFCILPPRLYSVDETVSSSLKKQVPINTKTVRIHPGDDAHIEQNCFKNDVSNKGCQESATHIERLSIDIPGSTNEFVEQCPDTHQNENHSHLTLLPLHTPWMLISHVIKPPLLYQ